MRKYVKQSALCWLMVLSIESALGQEGQSLWGGQVQTLQRSQALGQKALTQARATQSKMSLREQVQAKGFAWGSPMFIRIFKKENVLEIWMQDDDGRYRLFRDYPICVYSGDLGPKIRIGDKQSPEGVYHLDRKALRPQSQYHRALHLNFPNTFDKAHGRTGKYLMIHGDCVSTGCYAMGDQQIEEIYDLTESALKHGQDKVHVHAFPFRLTREQLNAYKFHPQHDFWLMLAPIYQAFESMRVPPEVKVSEKSYLLMMPNRDVAWHAGAQHSQSALSPAAINHQPSGTLKLVKP
ncbi:MAG: murein L,D-transpeptidase family protein [Cardiobacteriaceae bacterium]|nr:murein L,D-transpeptidase family protein [Cardiobacteriaceae bacterium]